MPLDASDRIRKTQQIAIFQGYVIGQQSLQPGVNVSSCIGFQTSTIHKFDTYNYANQVEQGRGYFVTCQNSR
jgi:hypothetical protein